MGGDVDREPEIRRQARDVAHKARQAVTAGDGHEDLVNLIHKALVESHMEGIRKYAWWKEGVQFVGSGARTLSEALKLVELREER